MVSSAITVRNPVEPGPLTGTPPVVPGSSASAPQIGSKEWLEQQAQEGNEWAMDYLTNYTLTQDSINDARAWTEQREDSQYQRLIADLKKVGINPYFALTGGNPVSSSSQGVNYQGSYNTSASNNKRTNNTSTMNNIRTNIFGLIGDVLSFTARYMTSAMQAVSNILG